MSQKTVLIIGASGYIGLAVGIALRNEGHKVLGVVRSPEGKKKIQENEIIPVVCEQQSDVWLSSAISADIVIDAIGYNEHSEGTFNNWMASNKSRGAPSQFVFTSGVMTYGTAGEDGRLLDETVQPVPNKENPHGLARKLFEDKVVAAGGTVVRPGWVYGLTGGHYNGLFFNQIDPANNTVTIKGMPDKRYSWIHINDLAEAYVLLCRQSRTKVDGQLFNFVARDDPSYEEIILAGAKAGGLVNPKVIREEIPPGGSRWGETKVRIDPKKAEQVLGWRARHTGFLQEMEIYYPLWKSAQKKQ